MKRYESILEFFGLMQETFNTKKPAPESGYVIKKVKKKIDGKIVLGWTKIKKAGKIAKKSKTGLSKSALKRRAKKAVKTKKRNPSILRKSIKKSKKTRKLNK